MLVAAFGRHQVVPPSDGRPISSFLNYLASQCPEGPGTHHPGALRHQGARCLRLDDRPEWRTIARNDICPHLHLRLLSHRCAVWVVMY